MLVLTRHKFPHFTFYSQFVGFVSFSLTFFIDVILCFIFNDSVIFNKYLFVLTKQKHMATADQPIKTDDMEWKGFWPLHDANA